MKFIQLDLPRTVLQILFTLFLQFIINICRRQVSKWLRKNSLKSFLRFMKLTLVDKLFTFLSFLDYVRELETSYKNKTLEVLDLAFIFIFNYIFIYSLWGFYILNLQATISLPGVNLKLIRIQLFFLTPCSQYFYF